MIYKFSKEKFNKNASKEIKKRISKHLDILEGLEIEFNNGEYGSTNYVTDNTLFYLYPVDKKWCIQEQQLELI